jgi:hypothetical protein
MIGEIFILPLLCIQEILNFKTATNVLFPVQMWLKRNRTMHLLYRNQREFIASFWECTYSKTFFFENCGLNMQYINAPHIILGIINPLYQDNTKDQVILILKYYFLQM